MKKILLSLFVCVAGITFAQTYTTTTTEGKVKFEYVSESTKGTISNIEANISVIIDSTITAEIEGTAPVSNISTGNKTRDKHLKSDDYFNAEEFPTIGFSCSEIYLRDEKYYAKGTLTIKGIEKEVTFRVRFEEEEVKFNTSIYADDFGVAIKKGRDKSKVKIAVYIPM